jgi:2-methylisocitrate lyase-like PEP mutase family enzyme
VVLDHVTFDPMTGATETRRTAFRKLHDAGCFVLPNAWDLGSARHLEHLGFAAVATTSGGFAFSRGLPDAEGALDLELVLTHIAEMVDAIGLPVNVDFESGYAREPEAVARNVKRCIDAGASGLSIEDLSYDVDRPLYDLPLAVARIEAARATIDECGREIVLTARAEPYVARVPEPLPEAVRRLQAYAAAGADVLYTPGPQNLDSIRVIVDAVTPKPVNAHRDVRWLWHGRPRRPRRATGQRRIGACPFCVGRIRSGCPSVTRRVVRRARRRHPVQRSQRPLQPKTKSSRDSPCEEGSGCAALTTPPS